MDARRAELLQGIPKVQELLESARGVELGRRYSRARVAEAVREGLDDYRRSVLSGNGDADCFRVESFFEAVAERLESESRPALRRVINGTGIVIHTNLGRVPLSRAAIEAVTRTAGAYSDLEYDLEVGERGSRQRHVEGVLRRLTGAEAAMAVNNNAAAVLLALNTLADGKDVIVSRGEQIEIGGSFRMPDVIARSGARMVEVGTTNKTRLSDYEAAITEHTRVLLKVHPSNYRVVGFTETVPREDVAALARARGLVAVEDLGSGSLVALEKWGLPHETTVQESLAAGMDVVTFSGDKLLGGPQAGLIVGRKAPIEAMKKNPLARALRIDKLSLAALDATLRLYLNERDLAESLPVLGMLSESMDNVEKNAAALHAQVVTAPGVTATIAEDIAYAGGGSLPGEGLPTVVVAITHRTLPPDELAARLRANDPPIIGRIARDRFLLDARTLAPADFPVIARALRALAE